MLWHFRSRSQFTLDREYVLWFVVFWVVAVPVFVVEHRIRKRIGPHEGFEFAAIFAHWTIITIGTVALVAFVEWIAGNL